MSNRGLLYDVQIAVRVPSAFPELLVAAASRTFISPSAYMRQALAEKLGRDGFTVTAPVSQTKQAA